MIVSVVQNSPAEASGLKIGDIIYELKAEKETLNVSKIATVQNFIENNKGKETTIKVKRGDNFFNIKITPRQNVSEGEGPIGVVLTRIAYQSYPWYKAPLKGVQETISITFNIISSLFGVLVNLFKGEGLPAGAEFVGPIGIGKIMTQFVELGFVSYIRFLAILSIYLAIFNILPIPALDGGKLMFLLIEKLKGKPVSSNLEQKVTAFFFVALLFLLIIVTIKDIIRLSN
jgi:regulator of sigma E protease